MSAIFVRRSISVRIFKTKAFQRWAEKINLNDESLRQAVEQMNYGQYEASLGGYLFKKRIAIGNRGKSGGVRTVVAFKKDYRAFFVYGFAKNCMENVGEAEMVALKDLAKIYFSCNDEQIAGAIKNEKIIEVMNNG
jgi:hypothetical protein